MVLPVSESQPTFFWMQFNETSKNGVTSEKPDLTSLGDSSDSLNLTKLLKSANPDLERFDLDHTLTMHKRDFWLFHRFEPNACAAELMKGGDVYEYVGPLVIVSGTKAHPIIHRDVTLADLRVVVDFLNTFDTIQKCDQFKNNKDLSSGDPLQTIKGVIIYCLGDRKLLHKNQYMEIKIKSNSAVFNDDPTTISKHMGLPLITFKLAPAPEWRHHSLPFLNFNPYQNIEAVNMNRDMDIASYRWGWANPRKWDIRPGSVLVVRADRKDITSQQVEALALYCMEELEDVREEEMESEEEMTAAQKKTARENFVRDHLSQAKFDPFFERLKAKKVAAGDSDWSGSVSPYTART